VWLREETCDPVRLRNSEEYVVPASTLKSMWAIILLNRLGPDYRIPTYVAIKGNALLLRFNGDPFLKLRTLDSIVRAKAKEFKSRTVYVSISFPRWGERYGYGWTWDDIKLHRVSPITPVSLNGGKLFPDTALGFKVDTSLREDTVVGDTYLIPYPGYRYSDPLKVVMFVVRRALKAEGKRVRMEVRESPTLNLRGFRVDTVMSPPLKNMLRPILTYSLNFHMDMLVAHYSGGITQAGKRFRRFMGELGMDTVAYIFDGSGLSRYNLIKALDGVYLVCAGSRGLRPYIDSLFPSPGRGTLRLRLLKMRDMVHAKTGTLFGVSALLGFYSGCNDRYVFGVFVQNSPLVKRSRDFIDSLVLWSSGGKRCMVAKGDER